MQKDDKQKKDKLLIEEWLLFFIIAVMFVLSTLNVFSRFIANYSIAFTEEIVVYFFVAVTMIGCPAACYRGANMGMEALVKTFPKKLQIVSVWLTVVLSLVLFSYLAFNGSQMLLNQIKYNQRTVMMDLPAWIFSLCVPIGSLFFLYRCLQVGIRQTKDLLRGKVIIGGDDSADELTVDGITIHVEAVDKESDKRADASDAEPSDPSEDGQNRGGHEE